MKHLKMLGLAVALAAVALTTCVGVASADKFTAPTGTTYTSTIKTSSEGKFSLHGPFVSIECNKSSFEAKAEKHGLTLDAGGPISSLTFSECTFPLKVLKPGSFDVNEEGGGKGDFQLFGTELTAETSIANCLWTAASGGSTVGSFTGTSVKNGHALIDFSTGEIPRTGHSVFCGSVGYLVGTYKVTTPTELTVD
jgi:hypothetical protein